MKRVLFLLYILSLSISQTSYCYACNQDVRQEIEIKKKAECGDTLAMKKYIELYLSLDTDKAKERAALLRAAINLEKHKQHNKALQLVRKAFYTIDLAIRAEDGDTEAAFKLASYYEKLERKGYRDTIVFYLYYKAYKNANIKARTKVGMCYEEGRCVKPNPNKAASFYFRSAELGEPEAMIRLGDLYRNGKGVEQSDFLAFDYYNKAFESNAKDTLIMLLPRLAECYSKGIGVEKDLLASGLLKEAEKAINKNESYNTFIKAFKDYTSFPITLINSISIIFFILSLTISLRNMRKIYL